MVERKDKKRSKFRIKWWWDSDDEEAAKEDPKYAQALKKADEIIKDENLDKKEVEERKDDIIKQAVKETNDGMKDEKKDIKKGKDEEKDAKGVKKDIKDEKKDIKDEKKDAKDEGYFSNWFGGDENKEIKDEKAQKDIQNEKIKKDIKDEKKDIKDAEKDKKKDEGYFSNWFGGDENKDIQNEKIKKDIKDEKKDIKDEKKDIKDEKKDAKDEGYFSNWFGGDENKEIKDEKAQKDIQNEKVKKDKQHIKETKHDQSIKDKKNAKDIGKDEKEGEDIKKNAKDIEKDEQKDKNEGYFGNWFGGENKEIKDEKAHKELEKEKPGSGINKTKYSKAGQEEKKPSDTKENNKDNGYFGNWFGSGSDADKKQPDEHIKEKDNLHAKDDRLRDKKGDETKPIDKSDKQGQSELKQSAISSKSNKVPDIKKDIENEKKVVNEAKKEDIKKEKKDEKKDERKDERKDDIKDEKKKNIKDQTSEENGKTNTLLIICGCINIFLALCFFMFTEFIIDGTVRYQMMWIGVLIFVVLLPFILLPFYKITIFRILAIISVILTIILLIYLYINRARVYFFKIQIENENQGEFKNVEKQYWSSRNPSLFKILKSEGYYLEEWVANSTKKGIKIFILEGPIYGKDKLWVYDRGFAEKTLKSNNIENLETGNPEMTYSLIRISWTKERSAEILKEITKTKFTKLGENYGFVMGIFDNTTDFVGILGTEPVTIYNLTEDANATMEYNSKI